jgi:hypothetical protein
MQHEIRYTEIFFVNGIYLSGANLLKFLPFGTIPWVRQAPRSKKNGQMRSAARGSTIQRPAAGLYACVSAYIDGGSPRQETRAAVRTGAADCQSAMRIEATKGRPQQSSMSWALRRAGDEQR